MASWFEKHFFLSDYCSLRDLVLTSWSRLMIVSDKKKSDSVCSDWQSHTPHISPSPEPPKQSKRFKYFINHKNWGMQWAHYFTCVIHQNMGLKCFTKLSNQIFRSIYRLLLKDFLNCTCQGILLTEEWEKTKIKEIFDVSAISMSSNYLCLLMWIWSAIDILFGEQKIWTSHWPHPFRPDSDDENLAFSSHPNHNQWIVNILQEVHFKVLRRQHT